MKDTDSDFTRRMREYYAFVADYLVAAGTELLEASLLTLNVRHFPMVPDLEPAYR